MRTKLPVHIRPTSPIMMQTLADEFQGDEQVGIFVGVDRDGMINITQGNDWVCFPVELFERFASEVMALLSEVQP